MWWLHMIYSPLCRMWNKSHQFVHRYPRSYRKATRARIMAGQSHHMRCELWTLPVKKTWSTLTFIFFFCFSLSLLMFQGIYSHAVDPVHRRGNSQPDLLNVKAQKDTFGWHNTHRVHGKSDINTMACRLTFSDISNIKQLKQVSCSMPTGVVVSSTLIFPVFSFFLSLSPPTRPPHSLYASPLFSFHL